MTRTKTEMVQEVAETLEAYATDLENEGFAVHADEIRGLAKEVRNGAIKAPSATSASQSNTGGITIKDGCLIREGEKWYSEDKVNVLKAKILDLEKYQKTTLERESESTIKRVPLFAPQK